mgnify:CR=1 FL=1
MKTINRIVLTIAVASTLVLTACNFTFEQVKGTGPLTEETREISAFSDLEINLPGNVYYTQSDSYSLKIEAQANLFEYIKTKVDGDKLKISTKSNTSFSTSKAINVYVSGPMLSEIEINGSGNLFAQGAIQTDYVECEISGSGNAQFSHLVVDEFEGEINGSGEIILTKGGAQHAEFQINGSGDIKGADFIAEQVKVEINGSGDVTIHAIDELDVSISGSGDVSYKGAPAVAIDQNGSGDVSKL